MSWEEQFPIKFDNVESVTLNRPMGSIECVVELENGNTFVVFEEQPDGVDEQLLELGLIE